MTEWSQYRPVRLLSPRKSSCTGHQTGILSTATMATPWQVKLIKWVYQYWPLITALAVSLTACLHIIIVSACFGSVCFTSSCRFHLLLCCRRVTHGVSVNRVVWRHQGPATPGSGIPSCDPEITGSGRRERESRVSQEPFPACFERSRPPPQLQYMHTRTNMLESTCRTYQQYSFISFKICSFSNKILDHRTFSVCVVF